MGAILQNTVLYGGVIQSSNDKIQLKRTSCNKTRHSTVIKG
jgi:hypothetical protein